MRDGSSNSRRSFSKTWSARSIELPRAVPNGSALCPVCDAPASLTDDKRLRRHRDSRGYDCPNRFSGLEVADISGAGELLADVTSLGRGANRLPATGECHTCGKWVPGERRFCGACMAKRATR